MKNKSLILLIVSVFLLVLTSCTENKKDDVTIFSDGNINYSIVTAEGASDEALELANALADLSGAKPELLTDASAETSFEILIGDTNRSASAELVKELQSMATVSAFHYIIAESDGKLVIISDADIGYVYALEYITETYISGGVFSVPSGTHDLNQVIWDDYYSSDRYYNLILAEADKNRYEEEKDQFQNEMNRYDDTTGTGVMTVEQAIEQYKNKVASFNTSDFGEYTAATFISANTYDKPTVYPGESHPRVLFTNNSIETVRDNLIAAENVNAYNRYITLSDIPCDGDFGEITGTKTHNYDSSVVSKIEAKAFRYAMTGEEIYGYEAIYAAKNAILTINVPHTVGDWCRTYGYLMYVVGCTYDWCYDLLTETDKEQLVAGCVNLLGMHLEIVCYKGATNKVPNAQGCAYGHGAEDQLLVDYLTFAIACYNEAPEIYDFVAGRILNDYTDMQNYLFEGSTLWEGSMYGFVRTAATMISNILINKMTDGTVTPFENVDEGIITGSYYIRPDGQVFRIGDINENKSLKTFQTLWMAANFFYAGNLYENDYLKSLSYKYLSGFSKFYDNVAGLSAIQFLAINDPTVSYVYEGTAPLTRTTSSPLTNLFARSANNDENAYSIYMTMPEFAVPSHSHLECGSFQIYYKGALATDSGAYTSWGGTHHMGYNMQTISSNSLLIYNPDLYGTKSDYRKQLIYTGGQSVLKSAELPMTLAELLAHDRYNQCTSLGTANVEEDGVYLYSYMGGDMTNAYDDVTVSEVCRYMFSVATGDADCPYVFMTFDRITSVDASYHKSALIHVQNEPTVVGGYYLLSDSTSGELKEISGSSTSSDKYIFITNGDGRLVVQSVGYDTEYTVVGGEDYEYWIPGIDDEGNYSLADGYNLPTGLTLVEGSIAEYGWGRIEISPAVADLTNHMLTVMYVTDAASNKTVKAEDICSDTLAGAEIFGKAVLFSKNEKLLASEASFTLKSSADCYVAGVSAGEWNIVKDGTVIETVTVEEGTNLITFTADTAGIYTLTPAN